MNDQLLETLTQFGAIVFLVIIGVVLLAVAASGTSLGRGLFFPPPELTEVVSKLLPKAMITDATASGYGEFSVQVGGAARFRTVHVRRREGVTIAWSFDPAIKPPNNGTFAFTSFRHNLTPSSSVNPEEVRARIAKSLADSLAAKRFQPADGQAADLEIRIYGAIDEEISFEEFGDTFDPPDEREWKDVLGAAIHSDCGQPVTVIARGSLLLDILDAKSKNVFWRATAIADVASDDSDALRERRTEIAVSEMLRTF